MGIGKEGVKLDNIGMIEIKLHLDLATELCDQVRVQNLPVDYFEGAYEVGL